VEERYEKEDMKKPVVSNNSFRNKFMKVRIKFADTEICYEYKIEISWRQKTLISSNFRNSVYLVKLE
jgi:hypothetical protein